MIPTLVGEVAGTAVLGGLCAYPIAILFMGQSTAKVAWYAYVVPFLISTAGGALIAGVILVSLKRSGVLARMQDAIGEEPERGKTAMRA